MLGLATVASCGPQETPVETDTTTTDPLPDDPMQAFRELLSRADWTVQDGAMAFSDYAGCCDEGAECLGNNPNTPYLAYAVPPAPGSENPALDPLAVWGPVPDGMARTFRLRHDEALVYVGTLPPASRYYGLRSYLINRFSDDGVPREVLGSLGASLNQLVVAAARGVSPDAVFGEPLVVVTTADSAVESWVMDQLHDAGFPSELVHSDRIATETVRLGLDELADTLHVLIRSALPEDPVADAAWRISDEHKVLRLTPPEVLEEAPFPWPDLPPHGADTDEAAWAEALDALAAAVDAAHNPIGTPIPVALTPVLGLETLVCITEQPSCIGDIRDRYTEVTPPFLLEGDDYLVVFGVNHERTGKGSYSNIAVMNSQRELGITSFHSGQMVGSASFYVPDHAQVDDLYAVTLARDCSAHLEACLEIPTGCPGAELDEVMHVTSRVYLEPGTGAAPIHQEMLRDRATKYRVPAAR